MQEQNVVREEVVTVTHVITWAQAQQQFGREQATGLMQKGFFKFLTDVEGEPMVQYQQRERRVVRAAQE